MKIVPVEPDTNRAFRPAGAWSRGKAEILAKFLEDTKGLIATVVDDFRVVVTSNPPRKLPSGTRAEIFPDIIHNMFLKLFSFRICSCRSPEGDQFFGLGIRSQGFVG
jgi:hypothetical protein